MNAKIVQLFCIIIFSYICIGSISGQEVWHIVRQADWECDFEQVFFLPDGQNGWAVGYNDYGVSPGKIIHTTDGGNTWTSQIAATGDRLNCVYFINDKIGWAGEGVKIINTKDGGENWIIQAETMATKSISFVDENNGWSVGGEGRIAHTTNGGENWIEQKVTDERLNSVFFLDTNFGWAGAWDRTILRTTNGGKDWNSQRISAQWYSQIYDISFIDADNGWLITSGGEIFKSTDGGETWNLQIKMENTWFFDIHFVDVKTGWVTGTGGIIFKTNNGGNTWESQISNTKQILHSIYFSDPNTGWAVGASGTIINTIDGGNTWYSQTEKTGLRIRDVFFTDPYTGWAVGSTSIYASSVGGVLINTTDGGNTWIEQDYGSSSLLNNICFINSDTGWAVGAHGDHGDYEDFIIHTTNGGKTWERIISNWNDEIYDINFTDANTGWARNSHEIKRTIDGGTNWTDQFATMSWLYDLYFLNSKKGYAVGGNGVIFCTNDSGSTWIKQNSGTTNALFSVHFVDSNNGWTVGLDGTVINTTDGGNIWNVQPKCTDHRLMSVFFTDSKEGWAVGINGTIIYTSDGGNNWVTQSSGTDFILWNVFFMDKTKGWAVGDYGIILKYQNPKISDNVPAPGPGIPFGFLESDGSSFWDYSFQIRNNCDEHFIIDGYESTNPAFTIVSPGFPQTIDPGNSIDITTRFLPTQDGLYQDSISFSIAFQDTNMIYDVRLSSGVIVTQDPLIRSVYRRAILAYDSVKYYTPYSQEVHNNLSAIYTILNDAEEAYSELKQLLYRSVSKLNLGAIYTIEKDYQQALTSWNSLFEYTNLSDYIRPQVKYNIAWVYDEIDSLELAFQYYSDVTDDKFANARLKAKAYLGRGVTVYKLGADTTVINNDFRQAIALDPHGAGILAYANMNALRTCVQERTLVNLPQHYALHQNYPNPFNPTTIIRYQLPSSCHVEVKVYNILGHEVVTLENNNKKAGYHGLVWDGKDSFGNSATSGIYFYRIKAGNFFKSNKLLLLK